MTYDAKGRMITASGTGFNDTYTYDGDGRRVKKSDGTLYWVDDNFHPLSIGTASGLTKDFVFMGDRRIAFVSLASGNSYYYLPDRLGSTAVIASGDGKTIQWDADYFPFGKPITTLSATSARSSPAPSTIRTSSPATNTTRIRSKITLWRASKPASGDAFSRRIHLWGAWM